VKQKQLMLIFSVMALLALLVAALIPDIEVQDRQVTWQPQAISTRTATPTPTEGWYDDLPTPSYSTSTPTPGMTSTPTASIPVPTSSPTLGITDIIITLTAESER